MMKLNGLSPAALADFFVIMEQKHETKKTDASNKTNQPSKDNSKTNKSNFNLGDLFANHPPTAERIDTLRKAAAP